MDKLAYHYNKKKIPAETAGKYLYYYPCANENANVRIDSRGFIVIEVTEKEWEALIELDRIDYNNEHKYVRHTIPIPNADEDQLTVKQQEQLHSGEKDIPTATAETFDKRQRFSKLSDNEKRVLALLNEGNTQKEVAKELGVTQGYVSMVKKQASSTWTIRSIVPRSNRTTASISGNVGICFHGNSQCLCFLTLNWGTS